LAARPVQGRCDRRIRHRVDQNNPKILFAGLWQTRRQPWKLTSGGPGSGLYRSADGGDTWKKLEGEGLPAGEWGKIGVRVAPSNPNVVYALIEAKDGGLFRSDDAGKTWAQVSAARVLRQRPWYYSTLTIDPRNPDVVWFPQVNLLRTVDRDPVQAVQSRGSEPRHAHGDPRVHWRDRRPGQPG